jgi:hypothetical protein
MAFRLHPDLQRSKSANRLPVHFRVFSEVSRLRPEKERSSAADKLANCIQGTYFSTGRSELPRKTAPVRVSNILSKIGGSDRTQAAISAIQRGLVHLESWRGCHSAPGPFLCRTTQSHVLHRPPDAGSMRQSCFTNWICSASNVSESSLIRDLISCTYQPSARCQIS